MNAEAIVWLIFILIWLVSGVVKQIKQVSEQRPGQAPGPGSRPPGQPQEGGRRDRPERPERPPDDPMVELLRQLGGEVEVQPEQPAPREYRPPERPAHFPEAEASERPSAEAPSRRRGTKRKVPDASGTRVAAMAAIPEMILEPIRSADAVAGSAGGKSALARSIRRQLRRPSSARRAIVLAEILGKPPGLRGL